MLEKKSFASAGDRTPVVNEYRILNKSISHFYLNDGGDTFLRKEDNTTLRHNHRAAIDALYRLPSWSKLRLLGAQRDLIPLKEQKQLAKPGHR
jgi:hypothetical protein